MGLGRFMAVKRTAPESGNVTNNKLLFKVILFTLLFVAILSLFHVFVFSDRMLYGSDTLVAGLFFRSFYVDYVAEYGKVPIWNPYQFCGIPYIDGFHGDTFYPLSILKFFIDIHRALGWNLLLHVFLAGITMFACARTFRRSQMASAMAAISYMFAAYFVSQVAPGHDGKMFATSLFPLTIMLIELGFRKRPILNFSLLGLVIGIIILTPHPQMAYYTLWACAFYFVFKLVFKYVDEKSMPALVKPTGLFVWAVIIGLAISAIQFYPGYVYVTQYSPRSDEMRGKAWAQSWSLHWEETVSLIVPEFCGVSGEKENSYWGKNNFKDNSEYAGVVPLLMALVAVVMVRSRKTWFFGALALFALIYGLSGNTPFFYLFYYIIPNVKSTRAWSMIMFLFSFSIAMLAAFGIDFIIEKSRHLKGRRRRSLNMALFALPGLVFLGALLFTAAPKETIEIYKAILYGSMPARKSMILARHLGTITAGFWITSLFLTTSALVAWLYSKKKAAVVVLWVIIGLTFIDAYRFDLRFIRTYDQDNPQPSMTLKSSPLIDFFKSVPGKFRVLDLTVYDLRANYLPLFGIEEMTSHHGNQPRWYHKLLGGKRMPNALNPNLMNITNTRYLLISPSSPISGAQLISAGFPEVARWKNLQVFENPAANDRAYIVHEWVVDSDEDNIIRTVLNRSFDPQRDVVLQKDPGIDPVFDNSLVADDQAKIEQYENDHISITAKTQADGILVLDDNWYPAWKAFLDGKEVEVMRVNGAFRGVVIPSGEHKVEFKYISQTQKTGRLLTLAGLLAVVVGVVGSFIPRHKRDNIDVEESDG